MAFHDGEVSALQGWAGGAPAGRRPEPRSAQVWESLGPQARFSTVFLHVLLGGQLRCEAQDLAKPWRRLVIFTVLKT